MPDASRQRPPTMADVAARAGVSHQTVSRVINKVPGVRPETADRVLTAIADLGYRPNQFARLLASSRSRMIGVATWGTGLYGPQQVLLALDAAARSAGYRITVSTAARAHRAGHAPGGRGAHAARRRGGRADHPARDGAEVRDRGGARASRPSSLEGDLSQTPLTAGVDNVQGGQLATRHLLELGHPTVVHVAGPPGWAEARRADRRLAHGAGGVGPARCRRCGGAATGPPAAATRRGRLAGSGPGRHRHLRRQRPDGRRRHRRAARRRVAESPTTSPSWVSTTCRRRRTSTRR